MIDFEQEIETRLATFQHLNGKGNVKDCNRQLYEIVRLMLGMINQHNMMVPFTAQFTRAAALDAAPSREAPNGYQIHVPASTPLPEPFIAMSDYEDDSADVVVDDDEVVSITAESLALSAIPEPINPPIVAAPYGYTKAGHARLSPPTHGLTANGNVRRNRKRKR